MTTLKEDFAGWWEMLPKYRNHDIPARKFGDIEVRTRHGSNKGWPGDQKDVTYWVELEDGTCVGYRHAKKENGKFEKYAEFPVVQNV